MKRFIVGILQPVMIILAGIIITGCSDNFKRTQELNELYTEVDTEIEKSQEYMDQREHKISLLKSELGGSPEVHKRMSLLQAIANEYIAYNSDSALYYVTEAEQLARKNNNPDDLTHAMLTRADIASHAGLFSMAHELLAGLDRSRLDSAEYLKMFGVYCALYQYEAQYITHGDPSRRAEKMRELYTDSLIRMGNLNSFDYLTNVTARDIKEGKIDRTINLLEKKLKNYRSGDRQYSILASILANAYNAAGDKQNYKKYLAITVISDIRGATKENMAIRDLATQVFEEGDLERAKRYVKVSQDDANYYGSRLRDAQLNILFPAIDKAYDRQQQELRRRLQVYLCALGGLLVIVIGAVAYITRQWKSVEDANHRVQQTNDELQSISDRLREANTALEVSNEALEKTNTALEFSNSQLKKSGRIAEEYTGLFMEYSSLNISLLEKYHAALRNLALQGNVKGILKKLDSDEIVNETIKAFYSKFDEAVLNIYPSFVEKINMLLVEEGRIQLKPGEKLNTELRVLAVYRLGISDPDQIAHFLRCSVSTVYTYRSRLKRRAIDPETFDSKIMEI